MWRSPQIKFSIAYILNMHKYYPHSIAKLPSFMILYRSYVKTRTRNNNKKGTIGNWNSHLKGKFRLSISFYCSSCRNMHPLFHEKCPGEMSTLFMTFQKCNSHFPFFQLKGCKMTTIPFLLNRDEVLRRMGLSMYSLYYALRSDEIWDTIANFCVNEPLKFARNCYLSVN